MKVATVVIFISLIVFAAGYVAPNFSKVHKKGDKDFFLKQKVFFDLLRNIYAHDEHTQYYKDAMAWNFVENFNKYKNVDAIKEFVQFYEHGMMEKDEVFCIMYEKHRDWAVSLFHVFYYANDWNTFYNSIVWAAYHVHPGMFVYALTVAVIHRTDMGGLELPAPFEIYPYYFFNTEIIKKAQEYKMNGFAGIKKTNGIFEVIIPTNYTSEYMYINDDQRVSYFTEDIALNGYYYYFHTDYPFWMGGKEFNLYKDRRGELYLFEHQQFLARYYMERLSNHLGEIPEFSYSKPIKTGYYPNLSYYNGMHFPTRQNMYVYGNEVNFYNIMEIEDIETRLRDAINYGFIILPNGTHIDLKKYESIDILGNIIQGNPDWPHWRFYKYLEIYSKILLGTSVEQTSHFHNVKVTPSVLEHYETAMRDPLFYMLYKRLINYYYQFTDHLPKYTHEDLSYEGVKIKSVEMDKLVTFFDNYDADITNAVKYGFLGEKDYFENYVIKARQSRLNHLPFTFKLNVDSQVARKSVVRVFLGPKYDVAGHLIESGDMAANFWLLDTFTYDLKSGNNIIERKSKDFPWFVNERISFNQLRREISEAIDGKFQYGMDMGESHCGFPDRLMLPKGWKIGMPFQFFFIIRPYIAPELEQYSTYDEAIVCGIGSGSRHIDALPFGYPFDRKIDEIVWNTTNMYYYDTQIFHKTQHTN